ncbi:MAG: gliding motility-associated C-terminal domain-containing protein, partial [Ginsengibacter sp.]
VTGKGFRGGKSPNQNTTTPYCDYNSFYYPLRDSGAADKGESIINIDSAIARGKGSPANGGGGGNGHSSGGGGGSNGGAGGFGGYQSDACNGSATDNRGIGGKPLIYNNSVNKIFMGGGGGSGHTVSVGGSPMNGGNGAGIIIIKSSVIIDTSGYQIIAKGDEAPQCNLSPVDLCHDGSGGGGGGGTVLIENSKLISSITIDISGGKGGDLIVYATPNATRTGPGGGGGAGIFWSNNISLPSNIIVNKTGGINGVIIPKGNEPYGTTPGQDGVNMFNLKIPVDVNPFKKQVDVTALNLMPNAFTPNGDGINDCFGIKYWDSIKDLNFSIYNRYGDKVFHTNNVAVCWDGKYKQQLQDANIYVYIIRGKIGCLLIERKGIVALIK